MYSYAISQPPSCASPNHLKTIMNASPSIRGVASFFGIENIIMGKVFGFKNPSHQRIWVGENSLTLLGQHG